MRAQYWLFLALAGMAVIAVAGLTPLLSGPHASAEQVPGGAYDGTVQGGGTVHFTVSGDGARVEGFTASDVPGDTCTFTGSQAFPLSLDIAPDHTFGPGLPGLYEVSGSFPSPGTAEGTLRLFQDSLCDSGTVSWTATTSATPPASPTPTPTATATATPTATTTPMTTPTATPTPADLATGWNHVCYVGPSQHIQNALADISQDVLAAYSLTAGGYNNWFPANPDVGTIGTVGPYEPLFLLLGSSAAWSQQPSGSPLAVTPLVQGWNSVCYAGQTKGAEAATQGIGGEFAVLYVFDPNQGWQRFVPGKLELSDPVQLSRFAPVLILVTEAGGTQWAFGP